MAEPDVSRPKPKRRFGVDWWGYWSPAASAGSPVGVASPSLAI